MAKDKENEVKGTAEPIAKKLRRGISNATQATTNLKFSEKDAANNGLFLGSLAEVRVDYSTNAESKDFPGIPVPRLTFHFVSTHKDDKEKRHVYQTLFPVPSNVDTIPKGKDDWKVNAVFNWVKHVLDVFYLKGRELTEEEEEALTLPFEDFDEEFNYVAVSTEDVVAGYRVVFENAAAMLNGKFKLEEGEVAKPCYKNANGVPVIVWMKLLRHIKNRKGEWTNVANGDLGFGTFIGAGVLEAYVDKKLPSILSIDVSKESITPKETKKVPTIGGPAPMVGMGGVVIPGMGMNNAGVGGDTFDATAEAGEVMPF